MRHSTTLRLSKMAIDRAGVGLTKRLIEFDVTKDLAGISTAAQREIRFANVAEWEGKLRAVRAKRRYMLKVLWSLGTVQAALENGPEPGRPLNC